MLIITSKKILTTTNTLTVLLDYVDLFNLNCSGNTKQIFGMSCLSLALNYFIFKPS